jgi:hypothetical protein
MHATLTTLCTQQTPRWPMVSGPGLCQHPGRDRTGPKRTGPKGTGPKRTGPKGTGPKRTGPDRPNRAGPARWRWCHRHLLLGLGTRMNFVNLYSVFYILLQKSGKRCAPVFAYLNFNNKTGTESRFILLYLNFCKSLIPTQSSLWFLTLRQRCDPFVPCLNFINKSETEPRYILPYLNFYNSLISTRSCLWFLKVKQSCDLFFPYFINESETEMWFFFSIFKFHQWEWNRVKIHFTIPKLLQVIDPLRYGFIIFHIWTLSTTMKAEMWSVFAIFKIYQQEWNRVKIIFTMRKLLHIIGSLPDVYGETETWLVFFHT